MNIHSSEADVIKDNYVLHEVSYGITTSHGLWEWMVIGWPSMAFLTSKFLYKEILMSQVKTK